MASCATALVVDCDARFGRILTEALQASGFGVQHALDDVAGERAFRENFIDIVIIDAGSLLSGGFSLCRRLRETSGVPIVIIGDDNTPEDIIRGLQQGADDFIDKGCDVRELIARLRSLLRRSSSAPEARFGRVKCIGDLALNLDRGIATVSGAEIGLTPIEAHLLYYLMMNYDTLLEQKRLARDVWGDTSSAAGRSIETTLIRLAEKIQSGPSRPSYLSSSPGHSYRFSASAL